MNFEEVGDWASIEAVLVVWVNIRKKDGKGEGLEEREQERKGEG